MGPSLPSHEVRKEEKLCLGKRRPPLWMESRAGVVARGKRPAVAGFLLGALLPRENGMSVQSLGNAHGARRDPPVGECHRLYDAQHEGNIGLTAAPRRQGTNLATKLRVALRTERHDGSVHEDRIPSARAAIDVTDDSRECRRPRYQRGRTETIILQEAFF